VSSEKVSALTPTTDAAHGGPRESPGHRITTDLAALQMKAAVTAATEEVDVARVVVQRIAVAMMPKRGTSARAALRRERALRSFPASGARGAVAL
jgi:hypothetical protein